MVVGYRVRVVFRCYVARVRVSRRQPSVGTCQLTSNRVLTRKNIENRLKSFVLDGEEKLELGRELIFRVEAIGEVDPAKRQEADKSTSA